MKLFACISLTFLLAIDFVSAQPTDGTKEVPKFVAGESWEYQLTPRRMNDCNPSRTSKFTITVQSVDDDGVTLKRGKGLIKLNASLAELQEVNGTRNIQETFNFPMVSGKKWEQHMLVKMSSGGVLQTDLTCEHKKLEKVTVPAGEFEAIPIVCKGRWNNLTSGNADVATYTYWYSPAVKNLVKHEVVTWFRGSYCADQETVLMKFTERQ